MGNALIVGLVERVGAELIGEMRVADAPPASVGPGPTAEE
jgi:hypothetical protein